jgi:hypothetical protein
MLMSARSVQGHILKEQLIINYRVDMSFTVTALMLVFNVLEDDIVRIPTLSCLTTNTIL